MDLSYLNLNSFLKLGFFLEYNNDEYSVDITDVDKERYKEYSEEELIDIGIDKLKKAISNNFVSGENILLPISGGLDSRAILAGLLECTEASNIYTYTFGTSRTLDYNIGNYIAKKVGTNHTSIPFSEVEFTLDKVINLSKRIDHQMFLFHQPPIWELDKEFKGATIWSGFMGGELAGAELFLYTNNTNLYLAKKNYLNIARQVKHIKISDCNDDELINLVNYENVSDQLLLEEQIAFQNTYPKFTAKSVLVKGFKYRTPFLDKDWSDFMLSVDDSYRINEYLYKNILTTAYPWLFSLKTKHNYGLSLHANNFQVKIKKSLYKINNFLRQHISSYFKHPYINYMDFAPDIRKRKDINEIVLTSLNDLKKRNIVEWINIDELYNNHLNMQANYWDALITLASLEIHLKAMEG